MKITNIYRWAYLDEGTGGIVLASSEDEGRDKVRKYLTDLYKTGSMIILRDDLPVWEAEADDYYNENHPDVVDCYG